MTVESNLDEGMESKEGGLASVIGRELDLLEKLNWVKGAYPTADQAAERFAEVLYEEREFLDIAGVSVLKKERDGTYTRLESYGAGIGKRETESPSKSLLERLTNESMITRIPDEELTGTDKRFGGKTLARLGWKNEYIIAIRHKTDDGNLDRLVYYMRRNISTRVKYLIEKRGKEEAKLKLAHSLAVLRNLTPDEKRLPNFRNMDIGFYTKPYDQDGISGDFSYIAQVKSHAIIGIVDISGHGITAAYPAYNVSNYLRILNQSVPSMRPKKIIENMNQQFCSDMAADSGTFATMVYSKISNHGKVTYVNAGHHSPLLIRRRKVTEIPSTDDLVLGVIEGYEYHERTLQLRPGDTLIYTTDGTFEAMNKQDELYGIDRLKVSALSHTKKDAKQMADGISQDISHFCKGFGDDVSIVVVKYH